MAKKVTLEFPEQLNVRLKNETLSFSRDSLNSLFEQIKAICKKTKRASCNDWMQELNIPYGVAVCMMDALEIEGHVKPLAEGESGPRKYA